MKAFASSAVANVLISVMAGVSVEEVTDAEEDPAEDQQQEDQGRDAAQACGKGTRDGGGLAHRHRERDLRHRGEDAEEEEEDDE